MMKFRMPCPNCGGRNTGFHQESGRIAYPMNVIFQCVSCGLQKIGVAAVELAEEALVLKKAHEKKMRQEEIERKRIAQARREAARRQREEEARRAAEALKNTCAWMECANEIRPNSKYCSRDCSNKNARHRHQQKKQGGQDPALSV